jgi:hypothetical protein
MQGGNKMLIMNVAVTEKRTNKHKKAVGIENTATNLGQVTVNYEPNYNILSWRILTYE